VPPALCQEQQPWCRDVLPDGGLEQEPAKQSMGGGARSVVQFVVIQWWAGAMVDCLWWSLRQARWSSAHPLLFPLPTIPFSHTAGTNTLVKSHTYTGRALRP
jgi:hypothetical protein